jgi:cytochrome c2
MAATDQTYRRQKTLDVVFAITGILMLLSLFAMFGQDYFRDFKVEQRQFRDVETGVAEQTLLRQLPHAALADLRSGDAEKFKSYLSGFSDAETNLAKAREAVAEVKTKNAAAVHAAEVAYAQADAAYRSYKADYDSKESLYNIAVDDRDHAPEAQRAEADKRVQELRADLERRRRLRDDADKDEALKKKALDEATAPQAEAEKTQTQAEAGLKKQRDELDRLEKLAAQKHWKFADWLLSQPVLDAANSPYRIQQYTLAQLPIDYSFKYVTRYDRCTTCHQGMERANYDKPSLHDLVDPPADLVDDLKTFRDTLKAPPPDLAESVAAFKAAVKERKARGEAPPGIDLDNLPDKVSTVPATELTPARITEFAAHPRLDLFVDSNSPHPAEKFGCTMCHGGQGSATDFVNAAHAPDSPHQKAEWERLHDWSRNHFWDFPMLPRRFTESTCLQCHHRPMDLVRYGNQVEAPKLVRGFELIRENGCFGCHEIAGILRNREVGPDLRLEPFIPLSMMDPDERAKLEADKSNPPGTFRKVGPSLFRLAEKTNEDWVTHWVWSPRGFRPTTKMPHFYGLSNNDPHALESSHDYGFDQSDFPAAEVRAIAYYLIHESRNYLDGKDPYRRTNHELRKYLEGLKNKGDISDSEKKELATITEAEASGRGPVPELLGLKWGDKPRNIAERIVDADGRTVALPPEPKDAAGKQKERQRGRQLFSERGCLGCHFHEGTTRGGDAQAPNVTADADFAPDLSHVAAKLGTKPGDEASARRWLVQWILDPKSHFPRTRMPYTHLTPDEAAAVAAWLLSEGKDWKGEEPPAVADPLTTYKALARVYLAKARQKQEIDDLLDPADEEAKLRAKNWLTTVRPDADESVLAGGITEESLKLYVARKAINRYGCFGCHNLPGFETSKPIGTALNDWGKKDPERLAFEDVVSYVEDHHNIVPERVTAADLEKLKERLGQLQEKQSAGPLSGAEKMELDRVRADVERIGKQPDRLWQEKDGKKPYEEFFYTALEHHQREGFLHQKLSEPRSYDYHRQRAWDDRLRMPKFQFAHVRQHDGESDEDYAARQSKEEAEAREAVMTFVLGLLAEPVPAEYVSHPNPDRLAEIRGRELVDYFNCVGCHQVRPGVYEFKATDEALTRLEGAYETAGDKLKHEYSSGNDQAHKFAASNAWTGPAPPWPDRVLVYGTGYHVTTDLDKDVGDGGHVSGTVPIVTLTEAVRFKNRQGEARDLPAGENAWLPEVNESMPLGGLFADAMVPYWQKKDPINYKTADDARSVLPPPLIREGQRVQPEWLFQFLRDPTVIRPPTRMNGLRMPRFNMSDEDARTLVNYFSALDKTGDPGIGLEYPYVQVKERDKEYWAKKNEEYKKRLGPDKVKQRAEELRPLWELALKDQQAEAEQALAAAEEHLKGIKDADLKKQAEAERDALKKRAADLKGRAEKKDVAELQKDWEEAGVYASDAYRLLVNRKSPCMECHVVGDVTTKDPKGPPLQLSFDRLRPDWLVRWLANPRRLLYPTIMPQNFERDVHQFPEVFPGQSADQVEALRDVLSNFPMVVNRPENRYYRKGPGGGS